MTTGARISLIGQILAKIYHRLGLLRYNSSHILLQFITEQISTFKLKEGDKETSGGEGE